MAQRYALIHENIKFTGIIPQKGVKTGRYIRNFRIKIDE
jgi:hypothetical protein